MTEREYSVTVASGSPDHSTLNPQPQLNSEFSYDGFGRRVKIVKANGSVTSTKQFVWVGTGIAEERDGNNVVTKQFYAEGQIAYQPSTVNYFYTRDHLGSVREVTDNSGNVVARYDYDPYGRVTKVSGSVDSDFLYTGHYYHAQSGLHLAMYRAYDAESGRWLNRDPIREAGGVNMYGYAGNDPINRRDPLGLDWHHMLPQAIFTQARLQSWGLDIDIHDAKYGWDIDPQYDTGTGGLHPTGWNADWEKGPRKWMIELHEEKK